MKKSTFALIQTKINQAFIIMLLQDFHSDAILTSDHRISYAEMLRRITLFSRYIPPCTVEEALQPVEQRRKVVVFSENREGYVYAFFAIWLNRCIAVPVDAQMKAEELAYILNDCKPDAVWTSKGRMKVVKDAMALVENEGGVAPSCLLIDDYERMDCADDVEKADLQFEQEQTALIIYTSGTTGHAKGVMLSFRNVMTNVKAVCEDVPFFTKDRRTLVLLPLHHVLPLVGTMICPLYMGAGVAIAPSMSAPDLMRTMQMGRIGMMVGVPRLWQTLYQGIMKKIDASVLTRTLYKLCEKVDSVKFSKFVFKKVHQMLGGNLQACISGGAALDPAIWKGMRTLGIELVEGYGMTECAPMITFSRPDDLIPACAGRALPSCEVCIKEGEICARGDNVMQGYYGMEAETAATIDADGWIHTGDLGYLDEKGHLFITGRKKELIVLSNGKNINPGELEQMIEADEVRVKEVAVVEDEGVLKAIICPQTVWAAGRDVQELETALKREVIEPFNKSVSTYKQMHGVFVYDGELPRTRLDKLKRFKLADVVAECKSGKTSERRVEESEPTSDEYRRISEYVAKEKGIEVLPSYHLISDIGFDSLDMVGFECFLDQTFGVELEQDEIQGFANIAELADYVTQHRMDLREENVDWKKQLSEDTKVEKTPEVGPLIWWMVKGSRRWMKWYFSMEMAGLENVPRDGQFILAANHQSYLDALFVLQGFEKDVFKNMRFFAKEEHVKGSFTKFLARKHGVVVLRMNKVKDSIMKLGEVLRDGRSLMIFPEGTRTNDGELNEFRPTFAIFSLALNIPILPVCIDGAFDAMPKHQKMPSRKPIKVTYLPMIDPSGFANENDIAKAVQECVAKKLSEKK